MFVGYTLAVLSILGTAKVAVALLVLGVPIIDTFWIIVRRMRAGSSPFTPDRGHIHHRLLDLGLSHSQTVLVIYGLCILLAVLSFVLSGTGQVYAFLGLAVVFGLVLFLVTRNETGDALEADTYDEEPGPAPDAWSTPRGALIRPVLASARRLRDADVLRGHVAVRDRHRRRHRGSHRGRDRPDAAAHAQARRATEAAEAAAAAEVAARPSRS